MHLDMHPLEATLVTDEEQVVVIAGMRDHESLDRETRHIRPQPGEDVIDRPTRHRVRFFLSGE